MPNQIELECYQCHDKCLVTISKSTHSIPVNEHGHTIALDLGEICSKCHTGMALNMDLPEDESDIAHLIPDDEWKKRHMIKNVRRFLKGETNEVSNVIPKKPPKKEVPDEPATTN